MDALKEQLEDERTEKEVQFKKIQNVWVEFYIGNQTVKGCPASRTRKIKNNIKSAGGGKKEHETDC